MRQVTLQYQVDGIRIIFHIESIIDVNYSIDTGSDMLLVEHQLRILNWIRDGIPPFTLNDLKQENNDAVDHDNN